MVIARINYRHVHNVCLICLIYTRYTLDNADICLFFVFRSARQTHAHETHQDQRSGRGEHILHGFQSVSYAQDANVQTRYERNGKQVTSDARV